MEFPRSRKPSNQFEPGWDYDDEDSEKDSKFDSKTDENEWDGKALSIGKEKIKRKLDSRKGKVKEWHGKTLFIRRKLIPRG